MSETPNTVHGRLLEAVHFSGYSSARACDELEWLLDEDRWKSVADGFDDINAFLATVNFSEFRFAIEQRQRLAQRLDQLGAAQRATARMLGVDKRTIGRDLDDGANAPPEEKESEEVGGDNAPGGANAPGKHPRTLGTGEIEWYTPPKYIEPARAALGGIIDLDPASCEIAQRNVKAARYFTIDDDGLKQEWHGRIWLNPPYKHPVMGNFVSRLVKEHKAGRVEAAILLSHNYTDTKWFHEAGTQARAICFTLGRINFLDENGAERSGQSAQGQAFLYFGDNPEAFRKHFEAIGLVIPGLWAWHDMS